MLMLDRRMHRPWSAAIQLPVPARRSPHTPIQQRAFELLAIYPDRAQQSAPVPHYLKRRKFGSGANCSTRARSIYSSGRAVGNHGSRRSDIAWRPQVPRVVMERSADR
jgi:hypothetical protein